MTATCRDGHPNPEGSVYCGTCGAALTGASEAPPPPPPEDAPSALPPPAPPEPEPPAAWSATHLTPPHGLEVRTEPSPQLAAVAQLPGGTAVRVEERLGAWVRITIPSGWSGWADGRWLVDPRVPAAGPSAYDARSSTTAHPAGLAPGTAAALLGGGASLAALFLPWLGAGPAGISSFDIPFAYLWSTNPQPSTFSIGLVGAILAGSLLAVLLGVAVRLLPARLGAAVVSLGGGLFAALVFAFGMQTIRQGLDLGIPFGDVLGDVLGLGAWIALVGSLLVGFGARIGGGIR